MTRADADYVAANLDEPRFDSLDDYDRFASSVSVGDHTKTVPSPSTERRASDGP